ncbi:MAG: MCE family protein, partial [Pseudomonadota bacterium]|nr:MCE family protein [Pseudomonadota bacterium]
MSFAPSQSLSSRAQDTVLGLFVVVAIVLGGWLFFEDTRQAQGKQLSFEAVLSSSYGLSKGSPVRLNGVNVGRIESIGLTAQGDVALTLSMQTEYQSLYREGSQLKIDSTLDIDNVLSGAGIAFIPGTGAPLGNGATLTASEPKSLKTLMEEWDIQALSQKVADILINL